MNEEPVPSSDFSSSERVLLTNFEDHHLTERYVSWLNDEEVTKYSEIRHRRHSIEDCRAFFERQRMDGNWFLAIEDRETGTHIGNMVVYFDRANLTAEMSILIGEKSRWGNGFGTSAWRLCMERIFSLTDTQKIWAGTLEHNEGMIHAMRKSGMVPDGCQREHMLWGGRRVAIVRFAVFRGRETL